MRERMLQRRHYRQNQQIGVFRFCENDQTRI